MHIRALTDLDAIFDAGLHRAANGDLPGGDLIGLAGTLKAAGRTDQAGALYLAWLDRHRDHPQASAVHFNHGQMLLSAGDLARARAAFRAALDLQPDFTEASLFLGVTFEQQGDIAKAAIEWINAVNQLGAVQGATLRNKTIALKQIARVFIQARSFEPAEEVLRQSLDLDPRQRDVADQWLGLRQLQCKWPVVLPWGDMTRPALMDSMSPLLLARAADAPMYNLAIAHALFRREWEAQLHHIRTAGAWPAPQTRLRPARLRIGYLCSDLCAHALGSLVVGIFGLHDRARFEVFAYYTGPDVQDRIRARIERSVDRWQAIGWLGDKPAAARIVADQLDILVDLNGHTDGARPGVIALRPAPIIVNWLGYPGSMGTPFHHYIIADETTIPKGSEKYYSETVRRLPCYQPNDRERDLAAETPTRAALGLPEAAMVYCCFNSSAKITQAQFARWLAILAGVPGSVLWLLANDDAVNSRLRQIAGEAGILPERLIFAARLPYKVHLARYRVADLFLDTFPYGAHTTASDALWVGLPVVSLMGRSFASRVCGSLLRSAGLGTLVCETADAYVATAIRLGQDAAARHRLRGTLQKARSTCALFDTAGLVRSLESHFDGMWADYASDALPVPDLTNLQHYAEIGRVATTSAIDGLDLADDDTRYRREMAYRHAVSPVPPDCRLWQGALSPLV